MNTAERTLSSSLTFLIKWFLPVVWGVGWGAGTVTMLLYPESFSYNGVPGAAPPGFGVLMLAGWVVGSTFLTAFGWGLKHVRLAGSELRVSNYLREIRVPLAEIMVVRRERFPHAGGVVVEVGEATQFGSRIRFIARAGLLSGGVDAVVEELSALARQARQAG